MGNRAAQPAAPYDGCDEEAVLPFRDLPRYESFSPTEPPEPAVGCCRRLHDMLPRTSWCVLALALTLLVLYMVSIGIDGAGSSAPPRAGGGANATGGAAPAAGSALTLGAFLCTYFVIPPILVGSVPLIVGASAAAARAYSAAAKRPRPVLVALGLFALLCLSTVWCYTLLWLAELNGLGAVSYWPPSAPALLAEAARPFFPGPLSPAWAWWRGEAQSWAVWRTAGVSVILFSIPTSTAVYVRWRRTRFGAENCGFIVAGVVVCGWLWLTISATPFLLWDSLGGVLWVAVHARVPYVTSMLGFVTWTLLGVRVTLAYCNSEDNARSQRARRRARMLTERARKAVQWSLSHPFRADVDASDGGFARAQKWVQHKLCPSERVALQSKKDLLDEQAERGVGAKRHELPVRRFNVEQHRLLAQALELAGPGSPLTKLLNLSPVMNEHADRGPRLAWFEEIGVQLMYAAQLPFAQARRGQQVRLIPEGGPSEYFTATVEAVHEDSVLLRWHRPHAGGPPDGAPCRAAAAVRRDWWEQRGDGAVPMLADSLFLVAPDGTLMPRPLASEEDADRLYAAGRLMALSLWYEGCSCPARLNRVAFRYAVGEPVTPADIKSIDATWYKNHVELLCTQEGYLEQLAEVCPLTFVSPAYLDRPREELCRGGRELQVTEGNKGEYIRLLCRQYVTGQIEREIHLALRGFWELYPQHVLRTAEYTVSARDLQHFLEGDDDADVADWRKHTRYGSQPPWDPPHVNATWLWEIIGGFTKEEKALLLRFTTAQSRAPVGGFRNLRNDNGKPHWKVVKQGVDDAPPSAHACYNQLELPQYSTKERMREQLRLAIATDGSSFDFE